MRTVIFMVVLASGLLRGATPLALRVHNLSLFVKDVETSMAFYSLLGFQDTHRFTVDRARAAWLSPMQEGEHAKLELIELPASLAEAAPETTPGQKVLRYGLNHLALDVTAAAKEAVPEAPRMAAFLRHLNVKSEERFQRSLSLMEEPAQMMFGQEVWETAVVRDPDGVRLELMTQDAVLEHKMQTWSTTAEAAAEADGEDARASQ